MSVHWPLTLEVQASLITLTPSCHHHQAIAGSLPCAARDHEMRRVYTTPEYQERFLGLLGGNATLRYIEQHVGLQCGREPACVMAIFSALRSQVRDQATGPSGEAASPAGLGAAALAHLVERRSWAEASIARPIPSLLLSHDTCLSTVPGGPEHDPPRLDRTGLPRAAPVRRQPVARVAQLHSAAAPAGVR